MRTKVTNQVAVDLKRVSFFDKNKRADWQWHWPKS